MGGYVEGFTNALVGEYEGGLLTAVEVVGGLRGYENNPLSFVERRLLFRTDSGLTTVLGI
jgi:hypothetical protein